MQGVVQERVGATPPHRHVPGTGALLHTATPGTGDEHCGLTQGRPGFAAAQHLWHGCVGRKPLRHGGWVQAWAVFGSLTGGVIACHVIRQALIGLAEGAVQAVASKDVPAGQGAGCCWRRQRQRVAQRPLTCTAC